MFGNEEAITLRLEAKDLASATVNKVNAAVARTGTVTTTSLGKATPKLNLFRSTLNGLAPVASSLGTEVGALTGVFAAAPGPVGAAVAALAAGALVIGASTSAASNLNEEIQKSGVVFGDSAADVEAFARNAVSVGLSERAALGAAGAFGNMFSATGIAQDESAKMSTTMVQLAADMASFNNEDPNEMLDKLRSGLAGEAEPLRRFGVLLSEASVQAYAYKSGIADVGSQLTDVQKVQARYGLILEQTGKQQGDVERSGDTLANAQRRFGAAMENLGASIGNIFLPAIAGAATGVADFVTSLSQLQFELGFLEGPLNLVSDAISSFDEQIGNPGDWARGIHNFVDDTVRDFLHLPPAARNAYSGMTEAAAQGWAGMDEESKAGYTAAQQAAAHTAGVMTSEMEAGANAAAREAGKMPQKAAAAMIANQFHLKDASSHLREVIESALSPKQERNNLIGFLHSKLVADGMNSGKPLVVRATDEAVDAVLRKLDRLGPAGHAAGVEFVMGIYNGMDAVDYLTTQKARDIAAEIAGQFPMHSPPADPRSPLANIMKVGGNIVDAITSGMTLTGARTGARTLAGQVAGGVAGGGGVTINFNSTIPPTPAQGQDLARRIGPELRRWMRNN